MKTSAGGEYFAQILHKVAQGLVDRKTNVYYEPRLSIKGDVKILLENPTKESIEESSTYKLAAWAKKKRHAAHNQRSWRRCSERCC